MRSMVMVGAVSGVVFLVVGNLAILGMSLWARAAADTPEGVASVPGVEHFEAVDGHVWRGSAPAASGYKALAKQGFTTVIDLRAEENVNVDDGALADLGLTYVSIPVRDGQAPSAAKVEQFLAAASASPGKVFVHCGAGVGRAGTMAAAWLVENDGARTTAALRRNLAVGPPSLEQLAFVRGLADGTPNRPGLLVTATSRVLDAPRRLWSRYGF